MKRILMTLIVALLGSAVMLGSAEAKRLGGGGSFGKSSPSYSRQYSAPQGPNQAAPAQRPAQPGAPAPSSPWKGILGGALLGLGLGALLSHFGLGGAAASIISTLLMVGLIALAAMFIFRLLARRAAPQAPVPSYAGPMERSYQPDSNRTPEIGSGLGSTQPAAWSGAPPQSSVPSDFDVNGFLRHAKTNFIRMQAAWDRADVNDIREFTTPEMFGELKMQLSERGATDNHTDVVSIEAELLGVETSAREHVASVRFHGMIREAREAAAEPFSEVWVLTKPISGTQGWLLAGLQQA